MNICANCQHFLRQGPIWYDQYCTADTLPVVIDPVSGEEKYESINDFGGAGVGG